MRRPVYIAVLLGLLVLLCWPRPIAPPTEMMPEPAPVASTREGDAEVADDVVPDSATDLSEFLRDTVPSTLPPPSDQGLLRDLEQAVDEIRSADEVTRDPIEIRPDFAPLLPPVAEETEPEVEPDPEP